MTRLERQLMHKYIDIINKLNKLKDLDNEAAHNMADGAILDFLREVGFGELAKSFDECDNKVGFCYA